VNLGNVGHSSQSRLFRRDRRRIASGTRLCGGKEPTNGGGSCRGTMVGQGGYVTEIHRRRKKTKRGFY